MKFLRSRQSLIVLAGVLIGSWLILRTIVIPPAFFGLWKVEDQALHRAPLGNCLAFDRTGLVIYTGDIGIRDTWTYQRTAVSPSHLHLTEKLRPYTEYDLTLDHDDRIVVQNGESQVFYTKYTGDIVTCLDPR